MSYFLIYTILILSLVGILGVLGVKTRVFANFVKQKNQLLDSRQQELATMETEVVEEVKQVTTKGLGGIFYQFRAWTVNLKQGYDRYNQQRKKDKLKKIQEMRAKQLDMIEKDQVIDNKQEESDLGFGDEGFSVPKAVQAQTVTPITGSTAKDVERKEVILINRIALDPQNKKHYRLLGDFYIKNGKIDDAKECFKHILKIDSHDDYGLTQMERLNEIR